MSLFYRLLVSHIVPQTVDATGQLHVTRLFLQPRDSTMATVDSHRIDHGGMDAKFVDSVACKDMLIGKAWSYRHC